MLLRIILVGAVLIAALVVVKQERVLARIGIVGKCAVTATPAGEKVNEGQWWSCDEGALTGFPVLDRKSCESRGFRGRLEIWYCPAPIESPY
jgi:hypothetical protein